MLGIKAGSPYRHYCQPDIQVSKAFYCDILGFTLIGEFIAEARDSWKGDLALNGQYTIELFSFLSRLRGLLDLNPVACAIWPSALTILMRAKAHLESKGVNCEDIRIDPITDKRFTFFNDPDGLPLELYQA